MYSPRQKIEIELSILEENVIESIEADELEEAIVQAMSGMKLAIESGIHEWKAIFWKYVKFISNEFNSIERKNIIG